MSVNKEKSEGLSSSLMAFAIVLTLLSCYWQGAYLLAPMGLTTVWIDKPLLLFKDYFAYPMKIKGLAFLLLVCSTVFRTGKKIETGWEQIIIYSVIGTILYFINPANGIVYTLFAITGMTFSVYGYGLIFRKLRGDTIPDSDEGFLQSEELLETPESVNIPYVYVYQRHKHKGWINCINPYRASMILGSPGSGKSFAIYNKFIEDTIRKNFTMFIYDYKFPDLTERVLTEIAYQKRFEGLWQDKKEMPVKPHLYIINFDDPLKSNRCNPIHHTYITDPADTTEIADLVFKNINKGSDGKGFDFFNESAKVYLDALVWFLANYDPDAEYNDPSDPQLVTGSKSDYINKGRYCTFPHVIELMAYNYLKTFQILQFTKGLEAKISPFASALEGGAMEQLQGQIASAQIPMGKFVSPALYWAMTGDDFTLDINNPKEPKIVCMGNNPDRQSIYGTTLALYTSRMFKLINHKHNLKSVVLLDELPTIFIKGLDQLIATARSNRVAIALGAQDKSQLRRDYGDKEAEVIYSTVGNVFSGAVEGRTAEDISKGFGKDYKKKVSESISDDSNSRSISYQLEDLLPASKIMDMTQGTFCGWVKDNFEQEISMKKFFGAITVDAKRNKKLKENEIDVPVITDIFNGQKPEMPPKDAERLKKIWPNIASDEKAIYKKYISELVNKEVEKNFNKIKADVKEIVEREFERTTPMAEAYKASKGQQDE
jgi:hypothetical protein